MYSRYLNKQTYSPPSQEQPQQAPPAVMQQSQPDTHAPLFAGLKFDTSDLLVLFILLLTMQEEDQNTALLSAVLYFFM